MLCFLLAFLVRFLTAMLLGTHRFCRMKVLLSVFALLMNDGRIFIYIFFFLRSESHAALLSLIAFKHSRLWNLKYSAFIMFYFFTFSPTFEWKILFLLWEVSKILFRRSDIRFLLGKSTIIMGKVNKYSVEKNNNRH